jgi:triphosphoribosyl-dephospho-CoA synthase
MNPVLKLSTPAGSLAETIRTACILEAAARKAGNVHPQAPFADLTFEDFLHSADAVAPILAQAETLGVGEVILQAVQATQRQVGTNTNLGILLLLAPLAAVPADVPCEQGIADVLAGLTLAETERIFTAIRTAQPGGLGTVSEQDVAAAPTLPIVEAMALAADRDRIARQYVSNFADILGFGRDTFLSWASRTVGCVAKHLPRSKPFPDWERAIIGTQLALLSEFPDSLILRKHGVEAAEQVRTQARQVLESGWPETEGGWDRFHAFDAWLREERPGPDSSDSETTSSPSRRNPGTTADLLAAILFVTIRDGAWTPPQEIVTTMPPTACTTATDGTRIFTDEWREKERSSPRINTDFPGGRFPS